jgi:hypothetical protein
MYACVQVAVKDGEADAIREAGTSMALALVRAGALSDHVDTTEGNSERAYVGRPARSETWSCYSSVDGLRRVPPGCS